MCSLYRVVKPRVPLPISPLGRREQWSTEIKVLPVQAFFQSLGEKGTIFRWKEMMIQLSQSEKPTESRNRNLPPTPKSGLQEPGNLAREGLEERRLETDAHLGLNSDRPRLDSIKKHAQARSSELSTASVLASSSSRGDE